MSPKTQSCIGVSGMLLKCEVTETCQVEWNCSKQTSIICHHHRLSIEFGSYRFVV